jgi:hypothetical protein
VLLSLFLAWQHSFTGLKASVDTDRVPVSVPLMEGILPETWIPWNACGLGLASWFAEGQATHRDLGSEVVCLGNEAGRETVEGKRYVEGNSYAIRLSLNLTAGWKPRNSLVASVADWLAFRGRRAGRTVCSRPRSLAVSRTHFSLPYGRPLSMLTRTRSNSFVVKGGSEPSSSPAVPPTKLPQVSLNHHTLERLKFGPLSEHMYPADRSVQDVIDKAPRCYSRWSWHDNICLQD